MIFIFWFVLIGVACVDLFRVLFCCFGGLYCIDFSMPLLFLVCLDEDLLVSSIPFSAFQFMFYFFKTLAKKLDARMQIGSFEFYCEALILGE